MAKKTASTVPVNSIEANASLFRIGVIDREVGRIEAELEAEIARLQKKAVARLESLVIERKDRFSGLKKFAETNRDTILGKDRKSVEFAAGTIGWRMTPPKVVIARGGEKKALEALKRLKLGKYIRVKESVDKELLLRERPEIVGITYKQREEFYAEAKPAVTEGAIENVLALVRATS